MSGLKETIINLPSMSTSAEQAYTLHQAAEAVEEMAKQVDDPADQQTLAELADEFEAGSGRASQNFHATNTFSNLFKR